jgi:hypothetical protein
VLTLAAQLRQKDAALIAWIKKAWTKKALTRKQDRFPGTLALLRTRSALDLFSAFSGRSDRYRPAMRLSLK